MAAALPLALVAGLIGEVSASVVSRIRGRGVGTRMALRKQLRAVASSTEGRPTVVEAGGSLAAMFGAAVAAGAAVGLGPGSAALVYLGLAVSAVGSHVAASSGDRDRATKDRLVAALVEPAFVVALGAMFLRWGTSDLEAARGTQSVLGPGVTVAPVATATGLVLAGLVTAVSGALRFASPTPQPAASALLVRLARLSGRGATALVIASLTAGSDLSASDAQGWAAFAAATIVAAVLLTAADGLRPTRGRRRMVMAVALALAAAASLVLIAL